MSASVRAGQEPAVCHHHGATPPRGLDVPHSRLREGAFGRMFRNLPPLENDVADLIELGCSMFVDKEDDTLPVDPDDNPTIDAGYTYFGQFIDHDITFDPTSRLQRQNDPEALHNFRTPRLDLDSVYGRGPDSDPYLYDADGVLLRIGKSQDGYPDLPRAEGDTPEERRALIPDPRNDENLIISQMHLAFMRYHNAVVETHDPEKTIRKTDPGHLFALAQRTVRWHYQWLVVHEFLPRVVGPALVKDILDKHRSEVRKNGEIATLPSAAEAETSWIGTYPVYTREKGEDKKARALTFEPDLRFYSWRNEPFIPVEFAAAAFRFGHSMVRDDYALNAATVGNELFIFKIDEADDLSGFRWRPAGTTIEWRHLFTFPGDQQGIEVQLSRRINTKLSPRLARLPRPLASRADPAMHEPLPAGSTCGQFFPAPPAKKRKGAPADPPNTVAPLLATRNLLRGQALGLPSGQAVARAMGLPKALILCPEHFTSAPIKPVFQERTPLWYYILKEAEVFGDGERLGPVGGRIVAEVLIGLLYGDPRSYLRVEPGWMPTPGQFGALLRTLDPAALAVGVVESGNDHKTTIFGVPDLLGFPGPTTLGTRRDDLRLAASGLGLSRPITSKRPSRKGNDVGDTTFDNLADAKFSLKDIWAGIVDSYKPADTGALQVAPALSLFRRRITPGEGGIPTDDWKGTFVYYVQDKSPTAIVAFTRGDGPGQTNGSQVRIYKEGKPPLEDKAILKNQTEFLGIGDIVMVNAGKYGFEVVVGSEEDKAEAFAVLLMATLSDADCAGQPCH